MIGLATNDPGLMAPLVPGLPYLKAEAVYAVRYEMAHTLEDVLSRRTRALLLEAEATAASAPAVAALVGPELGWDAETTAAEVAHVQELARLLPRCRQVHCRSLRRRDCNRRRGAVRRHGTGRGRGVGVTAGPTTAGAGPDDARPRRRTVPLRP